MSCGVGRRRGSDPKLLWLAATALIGLLAWEPPRAVIAALKRPPPQKCVYIYQEKQESPSWLSGNEPDQYP